MTKKDLLEFISRVETKAVNSVRDRYTKLIADKEKEVTEQYNDRIGILQSSFNHFSSNLVKLLADMREDGEVAYYGSRSIDNSLENLSDLHERIVSRCDFNGQVQKIVDSMSKEINAVKVNYNKVYVVAKNMGSAKEIAKYLKELGFDISSLENDNITALVADIDRTKLFVCGENK